MISKLQAVKEVLVHKVTSAAIGITVCALFGIPLIQNIAIALTITSITMIKDYFLRRYYHKQNTATVKENIHVGSNFDAWLEEEGISVIHIDSQDLLSDFDMYDIGKDVKELNLEQTAKLLGMDLVDSIEVKEEAPESIIDRWRKKACLKVKDQEENNDVDD